MNMTHNKWFCVEIDEDKLSSTITLVGMKERILSLKYLLLLQSKLPPKFEPCSPHECFAQLASPFRSQILKKSYPI
jgi:hypothetical protein